MNESPILQDSDLEYKEAKTDWEEPITEFDFSSRFTDNVPGILKGLNISLAMTSYQSQALFLVRSDGQTIDTNIKRFRRPMGLAVTKDQITLGTFSEILRFNRNDAVISDLDDKDKVDACFTPSASHTTGMINIHDIAYGDEGLWIVNSAFSCLATIEPGYSFIPRWKPPFITELKPEDRCHLNGMAMKDGRPKYVTTFNQADENNSWKGDLSLSGTLIDIESNEILIDGLIMPHSPKVYQGHLYYCESGHGLVCRYDPTTKKSVTLTKLQGFSRGIDFWGPLMFVGSSKTRKSDTKKVLPISREFDETYCGIWIINLEDNEIVGQIVFEGDVNQIYDLTIVPGISYPELVELGDRRIKDIFSFPAFNEEKIS
jgi:uncharacterized protein (TIGR03032 family)